MRLFKRGPSEVCQGPCQLLSLQQIKVVVLYISLEPDNKETIYLHFAAGTCQSACSQLSVTANKADSLSSFIRCLGLGSLHVYIVTFIMLLEAGSSSSQ